MDALAEWNSWLRECILELNLSRLQLTSFDIEPLDYAVCCQDINYGCIG